MIAALTGTIIAAMATASLLIAIRLGDEAIKDAGRYPLTKDEKNIILNAGYDKEDLKSVESDLNSLPTKS